MVSRRQPTGQFFRWLESYSEPTKNPPSLIRKYKDSDAWLWTEVAAVVIGLAFVIPTAIALWIDLADRKLQRIAQAWETVTRTAPGNSGKGPALEYLNSQEIPLVGIDLSEESNQGQSYLRGVNLSGANLHHSDLTGAQLQGANLSGANLASVKLLNAQLEDADLTGVQLINADLSDAYLRSVDLTGANLDSVNLAGATLSYVNLTGADLKNTYNLYEAQIRNACGNYMTTLPSELTIKTCAID